MALLTKTRSESRISTWESIFPNPTLGTQQSTVFVKKLLAIAVSNITYLRAVFPEMASYYGEIRDTGLRGRVARAHQVLRERETALLSELQQLEDVYRGEGVDKQIDQLRITKEQNIATLTYSQIIAQLDARMRELEASLETARDRIRRVELEWDTNLEEY